MRIIKFCVGLAASALVATSLGSCIKNDIPYPKLPSAFESFVVEGATGPSKIDATNNVITINLADTTDISRVKVKSWTATNEPEITPAIGQYIDLSTPISYTLRTREDYVWKIVGVQNIERVVTVEHQVGDAVIDVVNKEIMVTVVSSLNLSVVNITEMRLGPDVTSITPDPSTVRDFIKPNKFTVTYPTREEVWTMRVVH